MLIKDIYDAFQIGKSLANSAAWKNRAVAGNALATLATLSMGIASVFGYQIDVDSDSVQAIAGGIASVIFLLNAGVHIITSDKIGLPSKPAPDTAEGYTDRPINYSGG